MSLLAPQISRLGRLAPLAFVLALCACAAERLPPGPAADVSPDAGVPAAPGDDLIRAGALTITPDPITVTASGVDQRVPLKAVSSTLGDISPRVAFSLSDPILADIGAGVLRVPANPSRGGTATLSARFGVQSGSATVRVKVNPTAYVDPSAPTDAAARFGGAGGQGAPPKLVYPLDQAMLPRNLPQLLLAWQGTTGAEVYRLRLDGPTYAQDLYISTSVCTQDRCQFVLPDDLRVRLLGSVADGSITLRVESGAKAQGLLGSSPPITIYVSPEDVRGVLYYWSTSAQSLYRVGVESRTPQLFDTRVGCVGCHVASLDGARIGLAISGASGSMGVFRSDTAQLFFAPSDKLKANLMTFSPEGDIILRLLGGKLELHRSDTGESLGLVPEDGPVNFPEWSPDGKSLVYARYPADGLLDEDLFSRNVGDLTVRPVQRSGNNVNFGAARVIVPAEAGKSYNFYPSWAPDSQHLVFNRGIAPCGGAREGGSGVCGVYDAHNTSLWLARADQSLPPVYLERATYKTGMSTNWPRVAPFQQRGGSLIFITFSARFDYAYTTQNRPQLWMAAVDLSRYQQGGDPSYAPFWIPAQRSSDSNHLATWTRSLPCVNDQGCPDGYLCLAGKCLNKGRQ